MAYRQIVGTFMISTICAYLCHGTKETFNYDIHVEEKSFGQLKLNSHGRFADIINLDTEKGIKRLLCVHDKILIALKDFAWRPGQIVLGGSKWECSMFHGANGQHYGIYAKIIDVYRPKNDRLDLVIRPVEPFDLLAEASIHFHYDPHASGASEHARSRQPSNSRSMMRVKKNFHNGDTMNRAKRGTSNMLTDILNIIDWHKNVSMFVPFNYDARRQRESFQFSLKRNNGSKEMHVKTGTIGVKELLQIPEYFSLDCLSCFSITSLKYTLDLKIEKVDNKPVLKQYISQVESDTEMVTDFALRFREEMSINVSKLFWRTQPKELLRIPLAVVPGLPPVELLIRVEPDVNNNVHSDYFGKCHRSSINIGGSFTIQDAYFDVQAFGKEIWNKYSASGYRKRLSVTSNELFTECKAQCVGSIVAGYPKNIEHVLGTNRLNLNRNSNQFAQHFRNLKGDSIIFAPTNNRSNGAAHAITHMEIWSNCALSGWCQRLWQQN